MHKKNKSTAVLIINFNGLNHLSECYKSLEKQEDTDFDVWLVDNGSSDKSIEFTRKNFPNVNIFSTKKNIGYSGAYNLIHKYFKKNNNIYKYYLFLNNDTLLDVKMMSSMRAGFRFDKNIAIVSPTILNSKKETALSAGSFVFLSGTTTSARLIKLYKKSNKYIYSFWASGCCFMTPALLFDRMEGFANFFMYFEDLDYSWRLNNHGYKIIFLKNTYLIHKGGGSNAPVDSQLYLNEKNRIISYYKNLPNIVFYLYLPFLIFFRFLLISRFAPTLNLKLSKIKGMFDALKTLKKHKKHTVKFIDHLKVIFIMNKTIIKEIL